ncbi:LacI family DNA-binding transcriptional regulator [Streptomyces sp. NBC_01727]|uniref:LacI family DNA-binding transcriptional regulator n=1 Tax=Streptomyces sp. NBC_01727 TaxID=2975924 RepID=UPI002E0E58AF|nr:LacI family transcriptional regulator [Streptomyces sp. NBC_01727]
MRDDEGRSGSGPEEGPTSRVTMRDIAQHAGVHMSTVSRVLSQPALTSSLTPTAVKIRRIAKELGYEPDQWAASLRSGRTRSVGVVMSRLSDVIVATVFEAVERTLSDNGLQSLLVGASNEPDAQKRKADLLLGRRVDGLLLGASRLDDTHLAHLVRQEIPYVLVLRRCGDHPAVTLDDELGGYLAGRHLLEQGHRRLGVVAGPRYTSTGLDRKQGFLRACAEAGVAVDPQYVVESGFDVDSGHRAAQTLLARQDPPTGVFAMTDYSALGVIGAYRERGLEVGRDFALVGYHDMSSSAQLSIPLTSLRSPLEEVGGHAARLLLRRMAGEEVESVRLAPTLHVRASSAESWTGRR